jgi:hypothetical protein
MLQILLKSDSGNRHIACIPICLSVNIFHVIKYLLEQCFKKMKIRHTFYVSNSIVGCSCPLKMLLLSTDAQILGSRVL